MIGTNTRSKRVNYSHIAPGVVVGNWTVVAKTINSRPGNWWIIRCACGQERVKQRSTIHRAHSCGCSLRSNSAPYKWLYNMMRRRAAKRVVDVNLTIEEFAVLATATECHYCKSDILWAVHKNQSDTKGCGYQLDRKDPNLGYQLDNLVVCCKRCNYSKGNVFTYDEWKQIGELIYQMGNQRSNEL